MGDLNGSNLVWLIVIIIVIAVVIIMVLGRRSDNENGEGSPQDVKDDALEKKWYIGLAIAGGVVIVLWWSGVFSASSSDEKPAEGKSASLRSAQSARGPRSQGPLSARSPARGSLRSLSTSENE